MSFWDNVKKFAQPYADEEYDDEYDEELDGYEEEPQAAPRSGRRMPAFGSAQSEPAPEYTAPAYTAPAPAYTAPAPAPVFTAPAPEVRSTGFSGSVLNMNGGNKQEVVLFHAKAFDDAAKAADELTSKRAVILNMENVDKAMTRRVVGFLSGCVYALGGKVKKVAQSTYLFCPHSMDIVGDLEAQQAAAPVENYI